MQLGVVEVIVVVVVVLVAGISVVGLLSEEHDDCEPGQARSAG